jgi:endothelin-converting enzyme/putative endopeptidase
LDQTQIPSDRTSWGVLMNSKRQDALDILRTQQNQFTSRILTKGKAVNLYKTILDTVARDKMGIKPLLPYLAKIDKIKSVRDLQQL